MSRLADKTAFITGAGTGIGRATAILFAREGARVVVVEINPTAGEETAHLAGNGAIAIEADVTDPDNLQAAFRRAVDHFGALHVLHNNAGGPRRRTTPPWMRRWRNSGASSSWTSSGRSLAAASEFRRSSARAAAR